MKKITLIIVLFAGLMVMSNVASADMPDDRCYKMASARDNALANSLDLYSTGSGINPFTGDLDTWSYYRTTHKGITRLRTVYGNGDAYGYIGLSRYWVTQDGRAKVSHRIYGPVWSHAAWGFWFNFPFDDDPSTWVKDKEICNTL